MNCPTVHNRFSAAYRFSFYGWGFFCCAQSNRTAPRD